MEPQTEVFQARAPRSRLEQLSRCGSDLRGEAATEVCGNLAIANSEPIARLWADAALLAATHRPVSADTIQALTNSLLADVLSRLKPMIYRRLKGRVWIARGVLYSEISLLSLGRQHLDQSRDRAKIAKMRGSDFAALENDIVAILHDSIETAASNAKRPEW